MLLDELAVLEDESSWLLEDFSFELDDTFFFLLEEFPTLEDVSFRRLEDISFESEAPPLELEEISALEPTLSNSNDEELSAGTRGLPFDDSLSLQEKVNKAAKTATKEIFFILCSFPCRVTDS